MSSPATGQTADTPEAAVRALFAALAEERWTDAARLVDPDVRERFRENKLREVREWRSPPAMTPADSRRHRPEMPDAVAEWLTREAASAREQAGTYLLRQFAGVDSAAELERLPATEVMARWFQAQDPGYGMAAAAAASGQKIPPRLAEQLRSRVERTVIGSVRSDDSTAYVIHRTAWIHDARAAPGAPVEVVAVRGTAEGWRVQPEASGGHFLGSTDFIFSVDDTAQMREQVRRVAEWPRGRTPAGRAFLEGYGDDPSESPPQALVVEVGRQRVRIPRTVFEQLGELIGPWTWSAEEEEEGEP